MVGISIKSSGSFKNMDAFYARVKNGGIFARLEKFGQEGVDALANATPVDSRLTADSWQYEITHKNGWHTIKWHNTNVVDGIPVVILIQYGHGTGTGGYVEGRDFINPVIRPLFDRIADELWEQVRRA